MNLKDCYKLLFERLRENNIFFCSWKSNHDIAKSLNGFGDLDLYLDYGAKNIFLKLMLDIGFKKVNSSVSSFPYIEHFYFFDSTDNAFIHLHVYFKFVTGESNSKNYILPLERWIKNNTYESEYGINVPTPQAQYVIFMLRYYLKFGSVYGALLLTRDRGKYEKELESINLPFISDVDLPHFISRKNFDKLCSTFSSKSKIYIFIRAINIKLNFSGFKRVGFFKLYNVKVIDLFTRLVNKIFYHRKKEFDSGLTVAITGLDGSGKSTLVHNLESLYSTDFSVKVLPFGRPRPTLFTFPFWCLVRFAERVKRRPNRSDSPIESFFPKTKISTLSAFRYSILAYERYVAARAAQRYSRKGYIVFLDRYMSHNFGKMDSPRIPIDDKRGFIYQLFFRVENFLYCNIPPCDIVIHLNVSVGTSLNRNSMRDKSLKETNNEIKARHVINENLDFNSNSYYKVDAERTKDEVLSYSAKIIWKNLG
ncbi:hypothetical protein AB6D89_20175 [Vibrio splendidus]